MRVIIAAACTPFVPSRERRLAARLREQVKARGHEADVALVPFDPTSDAEGQLLGMRLLGLTEAGAAPVDRLITVGGPASVLAHPHKTAWVVETYPHLASPGVGDPWPPDGPGGGNRATAELAGVREARAVRPASDAGARRLREDHQLAAAPCLYPVPDEVTPGPMEDGVFAVVGPMAPVCRHEIVLEALRFTGADVGLVFVGAGDTGPLARLAEEWGVADRIRFGGAVGGCAAAVTFGVAQMAPEEGVLEAFAAGRPVIAAEDSGAAAEVVEDGVNGLVLPPDPRALASALCRLARGPGPARAMGEAGRRTLAARRITWGHVTEQLLR